MKIFFFCSFLFLALTVGALLPGEVQAQGGLVPCGGLQVDGSGNLITQPLVDPVPDGWQKISDTEMAELQPSCNFCHIFQLFTNIVTFFLAPSANLNNNIPLVPVIAGLLVAVGGFFMLSSAANPQNLNRGRTILLAVVIGLIIIYGSWVFLNLLFVALGIASFVGFGGTWWQINCAFQ